MKKGKGKKMKKGAKPKAKFKPKRLGLFGRSRAKAAAAKAAKEAAAAAAKAKVLGDDSEEEDSEEEESESESESDDDDESSSDFDSDDDEMHLQYGGDVLVGKDMRYLTVEERVAHEKMLSRFVTGDIWLSPRPAAELVKEVLAQRTRRRDESWNSLIRLFIDVMAKVVRRFVCEAKDEEVLYMSLFFVQ